MTDNIFANLKDRSNSVFKNKKPYVMGTGGFARLLESENIFDEIVPELVHIGLKRILELN